MTLVLNGDELDYLIFLLGGVSDYNPKLLGTGLSGEGSLVLRAKFERERDRFAEIDPGES